MPHLSRDLSGGLYEVHNVAITGVSSILSDEKAVMACCQECKCQIATDACAEHPEAGTEMRWILELQLAEEGGTAQAIVYHDVIASSRLMLDPSPPDLTGISAEDEALTLTSKLVQKFIRQMKAVPWTILLSFQKQGYKDVNSLVVRMLTPTWTEDGVVGTWSPNPLPQYPESNACPMAAAAEVGYDEELQMMTVKGSHVGAVRLLLKICAAESDEETAAPDTDIGLKATRRVRCCLDATGPEYVIMASGLSSSVEWLASAKEDEVFFVLARCRDASRKLLVSTHHVIKQESEDDFVKYFEACAGRKPGVELTYPRETTPVSRKRKLDDMTELSAAQRSQRIRLAGA